MGERNILDAALRQSSRRYGYRLGRSTSVIGDRMTKRIGLAALAGIAPGASATLIIKIPTRMATDAGKIAVTAGLVRARAPAPGDYWRNCSEAKAAGVAPLQSWEAGYRPALDRDADGEACEPYLGQ